MALTLNGSTGLSGIVGSAATPALQGTDTNTGYFFGTDILGLSTGGTQRLHLDAGGRISNSSFLPENYGSPNVLISGTDSTITLMGNGSTNSTSFTGIKFRVAGASQGDYTKAGIFSRREGGYNDLSLIFALDTVADASSVSIADEKLRITSSGSTRITKANDGVVSGALQINTTLTNYGTIQVRDSNQANISALQVENANNGANETNKVIRSVNLNSAAWANAAYHAKEHKFRINGETDTENIVLINSNGLELAATKGINFSAYASAASGSGSPDPSSNLLNDYEEGTWTPTVGFGGGSATVANSVCTYTKVGRLVHIAGRFTLTSYSATSGDFRIESLPFTINDETADGNNSGIMVFIEDGKTEIQNSTATLVMEGQTYIIFRRSGTTGAGNDVGAYIDADTKFLFGGTYIA